MTTTADPPVLPDPVLPVLLATSARTLGRHGGTCPICHWPLWTGERVADLPDGRTVHIAGCAAKTAGGAR